MGMKTEAQIRQDWEYHQGELAWRERRYRLKVRRFRAQLVWSSAIVYPVSFLIMSSGFSWVWWLLLPTPFVGVLAAWPTGRWLLGPFASCGIFTAVACGYAFVYLGMISWWHGTASGSAGLAGSAGYALWMVCTWLGWVCYGILIGLIASQFDRDTVQV
jgi:hypothetical protein